MGCSRSVDWSKDMVFINPWCMHRKVTVLVCVCVCVCVCVYVVAIIDIMILPCQLLVVVNNIVISFFQESNLLQYGTLSLPSFCLLSSLVYFSLFFGIYVRCGVSHFFSNPLYWLKWASATDSLLFEERISIMCTHAIVLCLHFCISTCLALN